MEFGIGEVEDGECRIDGYLGFVELGDGENLNTVDGSENGGGGLIKWGYDRGSGYIGNGMGLIWRSLGILMVFRRRREVICVGLSRPSHEGYQNTIELPDGNNMVPLRSDTIWLVQNRCSFHELQSEDPNQHLKDFLKLVDSLDLDVLAPAEIHHAVGGKLRDKNTKKSWEIIENLALYDHEGWNDSRDFEKPVLRILGSIFISVYAVVQKLKKDSWKELQFSLVNNSKLNVIYLLKRS
ncbi:hypothetical protein Tco_0592907 [Tanacetum coccineum]